MAEEFQDNVIVPPALGNFDEYAYEEGDFSEKAMTAMHKFRLARASLAEQLEQLEDIKSDIEHNMARMRHLLRD